MLLNIINYKLFKYSNKTYIGSVQKLIKSLPLANKKDLTVTYLCHYQKSKNSGEIFKISPKGEVVFLHKENLVQFLYNREKTKINTLLNINIKNEKTYEIIKSIEILQKEYLKSSNIKNLKYISHDDILQQHKTMFNSYISKIFISYVTNNTSYRCINNKVYNLSYLTPKKHFLQYIRIKYILTINPDASDIFLKDALIEKFDIRISTVQISKIRKRYFIPKKSERKKTFPYLRFERHYTPSEILTKENISKYKKTHAVYEILGSSPVEYSFVSSKTVYIGSSKDLFTRLTSYVNNYAHTKKMRDFIRDANGLYFRFIHTGDYKELEKIILSEFKEYYGSLPLLNTNHPGNNTLF